MRIRFVGELFDLREDARNDRAGSRPSAFIAGRLTVTLYSATKLALRNQALLYRGERFVLFSALFFGSDLIVELFPDFTVTGEIELNRDFFTLLVGDEMNSFHGLPHGAMIA